MTPASALTSWATPSDMLDWHHPRTVGDLIKLRAADPTPVIGSIIGSSLVARHLNAAVGRIEMSAVQGAMYSAADLAAMTGAAAAELRRVACGLAFASLVRYRFPSTVEGDLPEEADAKKFLKALSSGEIVLPFTEVADASLVSVAPTLILSRRITTQANRLFGSSGNRGASYDSR